MTDSDAREDLLSHWRAEETGQPGGWDFSALEGRVREDEVPWDFAGIVRDELGCATRVLDMGTGGGEFLLSLADALPPDTVATEGFAPNVPVARAALEPHGITVVGWAHDEDDTAYQRMPFPDGRFDLVINRHESYDPREIGRVLAPSGVFVTQQVGGDEVEELHRLTGKQPDHPEVTYPLHRAALEHSGLVVLDGAEHVGTYEYVDVAALVAYLQIVPWDVPDDFSVDRYAEALLHLHHSGPAHGDPIRLTQKRFWLKATRPAPTD